MSLDQRSDDHDVLTRIDANVANFLKRFEEHALEDKENFDRLYRRTSRLDKFLWMAMGAVGVFEFIIRLIK